MGNNSSNYEEPSGRSCSEDVNDQKEHDSRRPFADNTFDSDDCTASVTREDSNPNTPESALTAGAGEDDVQINLHMLDLMEYLQGVARESNDLPTTPRDDPELGKTVSRLTQTGFLRKAEAFIPADVRIISGTFTRRANVWNLPTSEEYTPEDGAQEPGLSHGGAMCNTFLKVIYDGAEEQWGKTDELMNPDAIFDDDMSQATSQLELHNNTNLSLITSLDIGDISQFHLSFAELLLKMRKEVQDIGFAQSPTITSSKQFDINEPFYIVPPTFDPSKNKKRSLLIGCNYEKIHGAKLKQSHDDIKSIRDFLVNVHGFPETEDCMTILADDGEHDAPTHHNIIEAFKFLSEASRMGDVVFVQFSGHGCRILDTPINPLVESYDEALVPIDIAKSGLIRDTLIYKTLLAPMPSGVTLTCLIDVCDTGVCIDLPFSWNSKEIHSVPMLLMNPNFSFVRFLKVIKTLYESSMFTKLGKTVNGALIDAKSPRDERMANNKFDDDDSDANSLDGSLCTVHSNEQNGEDKQSSFFNPFTACSCGVSDEKPNDVSLICADNVSNTNEKHATLLTKVMACSIMDPADKSFEVDSFHNYTDSYDDDDGSHYSDDVSLDRPNINRRRRR